MAENLWVEQYRREPEKEDRKEILDKAISEEGLTEENALRLQFFEARYEENKKVKIDHFIRGWMSLAYVENESNSFFGKNRVKKEIAKIRSDFLLDLAKELFSSPPPRKRPPEPTRRRLQLRARATTLAR